MQDMGSTHSLPLENWALWPISHLRCAQIEVGDIEEVGALRMAREPPHRVIYFSAGNGKKKHMLIYKWVIFTVPHNCQVSNLSFFWVAMNRKVISRWIHIYMGNFPGLIAI